MGSVTFDFHASRVRKRKASRVVDSILIRIRRQLAFVPSFYFNYDALNEIYTMVYADISQSDYDRLIPIIIIAKIKNKTKQAFFGRSENDSDSASEKDR